MSNVIPMVSASPPPDDGGGFDDWGEDDDEFGTFASAPCTSFTKDKHFHAEFPPAGKHSDVFHDNTLKNSAVKDIKEPNDLEQFQFEESPTTMDQCGQDQPNRTGGLVDSGVYSSNVSPIQSTVDSSKDIVSEHQDHKKTDVTENCSCNLNSVPNHSENITDYDKTQEEIISNIDNHSMNGPVLHEDGIPPVDIPPDNVQNSVDVACTTENMKSESSLIVDNHSSSSEDPEPNTFNKCVKNDNINDETQDSNVSVETEQTFRFSTSAEELTSHSKNVESDKEPPETIYDNEEVSSGQKVNSEREEESAEQSGVQEVCSDDKISGNETNTLPNDESQASKGETNASIGSSPESVECSANTNNELEEQHSQSQIDTLDSNDEISECDIDHKQNSDHIDDAAAQSSGIGDELSSAKCQQSESNTNTLGAISGDEVTNVETDNRIPEAVSCDDEEFGNFGTFDSNDSATSCPDTNDSIENKHSIDGTKDVIEVSVDQETMPEPSDKVADTDSESDDFGDFGTVEGSEWSEFPKSVKVENSDQSQDKDNSAFTEFSSTSGENPAKVEDNEAGTSGDWAAFSESKASAFSEFDTADGEPKETGDWAAFSEPQTLDAAADDDVDDDWGDFGQEDTPSTELATDSLKTTTILPPGQLSSMTKEEKMMYAVTACFSGDCSDGDLAELELSMGDVFSVSGGDVWKCVQGAGTADSLTYQWTKSQWNDQLFTTLHVDTRNVLIGHRKAPVPVYAAGMTMLEPIKGSPPPTKPELLPHTAQPSLPNTTQMSSKSVPPPLKNESIPAAQFDWSSSGLTNPLEELESEFLSSMVPSLKPSIQPLESLLANMKTTPTFKLTNQERDMSQEAAKIVQSLPDLSFMKSNVLMFPVKMN
ncbi:aftiphilin-like isoform X3 [Mya arenaria]|uniref:aftiphilin-like isoform X3 n=1 Tax=Mya arenaria TaxID=6604 RepID=UPI0022E5884C|nr:aftiphilin-like isoform X3 [Mya arenaria]